MQNHLSYKLPLCRVGTGAGWCMCCLGVCGSLGALMEAGLGRVAASVRNNLSCTIQKPAHVKADSAKWEATFSCTHWKAREPGLACGFLVMFESWAPVISLLHCLLWTGPVLRLLHVPKRLLVLQQSHLYSRTMARGSGRRWKDVIPASSLPPGWERTGMVEGQKGFHVELQ